MDEMSGKYIVIEGNDGTGKSTQVQLLAEHFLARGREVCVVEEPGSDDPDKTTPVANELRRLIKNGELSRAAEINVGLFSAARRELWQCKIRPALERGSVVISARNYFSTLAYQGYGEGLDLDEIVRMTELFTDARYMQPDCAVILTLSDQLRTERILERGVIGTLDPFESRLDDFQSRVNDGYRKIANKYNIPTIDANDSPEAVQEAIIEKLGEM